MSSLNYVLQKPAVLPEAPDLFCLDLLNETDLDPSATLASPTQVRSTAAVKLDSR